jgi:hypothetical protein
MQLETAETVEQLQDDREPPEERHRSEPRRHEDEVEVARRERITPHPGTESDHAQGSQPAAQRRQVVTDEIR